MSSESFTLKPEDIISFEGVLVSPEKRVGLYAVYKCRDGSVASG